MPGPQKKRKRVDIVNQVLERQPTNSSVRGCDNTSSINCVGCNGIYLRPFGEYPGYNHGQSIFSEVATKTNGVVAFRNKGDSDGRLRQSSNQDTTDSRKRLRPFRWQRRRNRRQINFEEPSDKMPSAAVCIVEDGLHGRLQFDFNRVSLKTSFS